jgi:hypothetical protein
MKILSVVSLYFPLISGFRIPANQTDGVYKAYYNKAGNETHVLLTPEILQDDAARVIAAHLVAIPTVTNSSVLRRDAYRRSYCECNDNLDHSDTDAATDRLRDVIDRAGGTAYVPIGEGIYGTVQGVTAFICTPKKNTAVTPVDKAAYDYALDFITDRCGRYVPGMYIHGDMNGEDRNQKAAQEDMGYKNNKYGDVWVCEHAEDPQSEDCWWKR